MKQWNNEVHKHMSDVVTIILVFNSRVSEANDKYHVDIIVNFLL